MNALWHYQLVLLQQNILLSLPPLYCYPKRLFFTSQTPHTGFQYCFIPTMYPQHLGGNPLQQASGSATQSSTTSAPRAAEPTFIPVAGQEPEGSRKRQRYWEEDSTDSEEEAEFDPESYYQSTPQKMAKVVDDFIGKTFGGFSQNRKDGRWLRNIQSPVLPQLWSQTWTKI